MNINEKERFLEKVRFALGHSKGDDQRRMDIFSVNKGDEYKKLLRKINKRTEGERQALLNKLIEQGKPLNLNVIPKKDVESVALAIAELVEQKKPEWGGEKSVIAWKHPLVEQLKLEEVLSKQKVPVYISEIESAGAQDVKTMRDRVRKQVIDSYIGVTSADFCIADTATLVIKTRQGQARAVSLVPSIHIAVIEIQQIIANLKELYTILKWDPKEKAEGLTNCMSLISGPSKTADIELVMVHGAHGPYELYMYVITG